MRNDMVTLFLIVLVVVLAVCLCTLALWQPPIAIQEMLRPTTIATVEPTTDSVAPSEPTANPTVSTSSTETSAEASTETTTHEHEYTFKVTKTPTCTSSGLRTYTCPCGASYQETIEQLAHAYAITVQEPTCTSNGRTSYTCKNCGYSYSEFTQAAVGHSYGPWITIQAPTETALGIAERTCSRCGDKDTTTLRKSQEPNHLEMERIDYVIH